MSDWTVDPETGRSNSSPEFLHLVDEVARIIRNQAATLIAGRADHVARVIMAQLAHRYDLAPVPHEHKWYFNDLDGNPFAGICMLCGTLNDTSGADKVAVEVSP